MADDLKSTVLHDAHVALGARMVPFAGYAMPVQYPDGIMAEHRWCRESCGAFDVSHMGPFFFSLNDKTGDREADHAAIAAIAEKLGPRDLAGLKPGQIRYTVLLNDEGGMIDDLMVARPCIEANAGTLYVVVNAGGKERDFALFEAAAAGKATLKRADDRALIAVQGPKAVDVVGAIFPEARDLGFMTFVRLEYEGEGVLVARSGYTGEDGFEILVMPSVALSFWNRLLADPRVKPVGLGARDSLRLEAGLPLYGHDADETVSPIEAGLGMAVSPSRRRKGDFPGAARIERELSGGLARVRAGLLVEGAPAREGAVIADANGVPVGVVTSGGFSPSLSRPIAMGFVPPELAKAGTQLTVIVRDKPQSAVVTDMPFVPHRYHRKAQETV
ncbi:MAG: glycine cleavage system aminomethyltransferase GcvT [Alphaproteobacteria bacterium]